MIDRTHGGDVKQYSAKVLSGAQKITDFSVNINPLGLSEGAKNSIIKNINNVASYPEPESRSLKKALGDFYSINQDNIAVGNGSIELIYLMPRAVQAKNSLIISPSFSEYEISAGINGLKASFFNTKEDNSFRIEAAELKKFIPKQGMVFLGNPNNPTGGYLADDEVLSLLDKCKRYGTTLVLDQAFADFTGYGGEKKLLSLAQRNKTLLIIRSMTKFFAMPGLRIGYAVGHREIIRKICRFQYPWNVNSLAQIAALAVLRDREYMIKSREYVSKERQYLFENLSGIKGLKLYPSNSNFMLCNLMHSAIKSAGILNEALVKKGIVIRNCSNFRGLSENFFRVAVRKRWENLKLISALKEIL